MARWIDVRAQFNGGEPHRLKVRCLGVKLRGLKDELNEFNKGVNTETQGGWKTFSINVQRSMMGEYLGEVRERRKRDEHVLGAQHIPVDRYACNVAEIN